MRVAAFLSLCLIWGTSWVAIKFSLMGIPPMLGVAFRFLLAAFLLWVFCRWQGLRLPSLPRPRYLLIILTGILHYLVDYGLIYWAEQHLSAGVTAILFATFPHFVALFSHFGLRGERFSPSLFLGLLSGFSGVFVIFSGELFRTQVQPQVLWAGLAVLTSALAGALSVVLVKKYLSSLPAPSLTLHQMAWSLPTLFLAASWRAEWSRLEPAVEAVAALIYLAGAASALAFSLYYWLLQKASAVTLSLVIYITPVVALFSGHLLLGEELHPRSFLGMVLILAGIALADLKGTRGVWLRLRAGLNRLF